MAQGFMQFQLGFHSHGEDHRLRPQVPLPPVSFHGLGAFRRNGRYLDPGEDFNLMEREKVQEHEPVHVLHGESGAQRLVQYLRDGYLSAPLRQP